MGATIICLFIISIVDAFSIIVVDCLKGRATTVMDKSSDEKFKEHCRNKIIKMETASAWLEASTLVLLIILFTASAAYHR